MTISEADSSMYQIVEGELESSYQENEEKTELSKRSDRRRNAWSAQPIIPAVVLMIITIIAATLVSQKWSALKSIHIAAKNPCGKSHLEAQDAGCTFDVMMDEWLTNDCRDPDLTEEFKAIKQWPFFSDANGTRRISEDELSHRVVAYTTLEYHVAHCSFAMRKLHRAILHGRQIETNVAAEAHTTHCAEFLRGKIGELELVNRGGGNLSVEDVITPLHPGYPRCIDAKSMLRKDR